MENVFSGYEEELDKIDLSGIKVDEMECSEDENGQITCPMVLTITRKAMVRNYEEGKNAFFDLLPKFNTMKEELERLIQFGNEIHQRTSESIKLMEEQLMKVKAKHTNQLNYQNEIDKHYDECYRPFDMFADKFKEIDEKLNRFKETDSDEELASTFEEVRQFQLSLTKFLLKDRTSRLQSINKKFIENNELTPEELEPTGNEFTERRTEL